MSAISPSPLDVLEKNKNMDRYAFAVLLEIDLELNLFKDFLTFEFAEENLLFWREIFAYNEVVAQNLKPNEELVHGSRLYKVLKRKALKMAVTFIEDKAPMEVNISGETRRKLLDAIRVEKTYGSDIFKAAKIEIEEMMVSGAFPRFARNMNDIIDKSWAKISKSMSGDEIGKILFMNWFMEAPEVMPKFKTNMAKHTKMWVHMFDTAVRLLGDLKALIPKLLQLGTVHVNYGVKEDDFNKLHKAMLQTLVEISDSTMTDEEKRTWDMVFRMMCAVMKMSLKRQLDARQRRSQLNVEEPSKSFDVKSMSKMDIVKIMLFGAKGDKKISREGLDLHYDEKQFEFYEELLDFQRQVTETKISDEILLRNARHIVDQFIDSKEDNYGIPKVVRATISSEVSRIGTVKAYHLHPNLFDDAIEVLEARFSSQKFPTVKPEVCAKVKELWEMMVKHLSTAQIGKIVFITFFQLCPEVVPLFKNDIAKHGGMIAGMMSMAVSQLDNLEELIPSILEVGGRHHNYLVKPEYFEKLEEAMAETFESSLGKEAFTEEHRKAWKIAFSLLTSLMISAFELAKKNHHSSDGSVSVEENSSEKSNGTSKRKSPKSPLSTKCILM